MQYLVLTTGSCGNCYIFKDGDETLIVDAGVTYKKLSTELEMHEISFSTVKALMLTHFHPDHSKGVKAFTRKTDIPVYVSHKSYDECTQEMQKQKIDKNRLSYFEFGQELSIGGFRVTPFETSHDSVGSSGYFICHGDNKVFLMTDTGVIPESAYMHSKDASLKFIESNYDPEMLDNGHYAAWLKKRIKGCYGHLSNDDAVRFAAETSKRGDQIYFVHVSENNNKTSLVQELVNSIIPSGIFVKVLERGEMTGGYINE